MLLGMIQNNHKQESAKLKFIPICRMPAAMNSFQPALGCFILPTQSGAGGRIFMLLPQLILLEFTAQWGLRVRIRSAMTDRPSHTVLLTYLSSFRSRPAARRSPLESEVSWARKGRETAIEEPMVEKATWQGLCSCLS